MDPKERAIRALYEARVRRDWTAVGTYFADEIGWHEPGEEVHSDDFRGREDVVALLQKLVEVTDGTFQLEPEAFLSLEQHSAAIVRWSAERDGRRSKGREIGVYRFEDNKIAQVWFYNEPADRDVFSALFAFE